MKKTTFAALSERSFLYLWIGEIFTLIPTHLFNFFLVLLVFKITKSNTAVSGVVLSFTIPSIFLGSIAGAYVDRWNKTKVIIFSNLSRAVLMLILILFYKSLFMIYAISLIVTTLVQFFIPAETPMVPLVVQKKNLLSANALFGMAMFGSILIAYILSGPAIIFLKPNGTLVLLAILLLLGALFISFIKSSSKNDSSKILPNPDLYRDLKQTLQLMAKTKEISRGLILLSLSQILILVIATIAPGYASQVLDIPIEQFPILFAVPASLGMIIGALLVAGRFHDQKKENLIKVGIFISGFSMMFLPFGSKVASRGFVQSFNQLLPSFLEINILHIMVVLALILGFANSLVFVPANTSLQENTTDEVRGKIYGFLNSIIGALSLLPIIIAGGLSDLIGVGSVITFIGISIVIFGVFWIVKDKYFI